METLPNELVLIILEELDSRSIASLCLTSKRFQAVIQPVIFKEFKDAAGVDSERILSFRKAIKNRKIQSNAIEEKTTKKPDDLGGYVQSISVTHIKEEVVASVLVPLLFQTPNLRSLSFHASQTCLKLMAAFLEMGSLSLSRLEVFRSYLTNLNQPNQIVPLQIWEPVLCLPQLSTFQASYCSGEIQLSNHISQSLDHMTISHSDLSDETIITLFKKFSPLKSFRYYMPLNNPGTVLDAERISAVVSKSETLEELWIQFPDSYFVENSRDMFSRKTRDYESFPKLGSLMEMSSLERMLVDQGILKTRPCLPSTLRTLVVAKCYWPTAELLQNLSREAFSSLSALEFLYLYDVSMFEVGMRPDQLPLFPEKVKVHLCYQGCDKCWDFVDSLWRQA